MKKKKPYYFWFSQQQKETLVGSRNNSFNRREYKPLYIQLSDGRTVEFTSCREKAKVDAEWDGVGNPPSGLGPDFTDVVFLGIQDYL